jgi:hypothetical protein
MRSPRELGVWALKVMWSTIAATNRVVAGGEHQTPFAEWRGTCQTDACSFLSSTASI